MFLVCLQKVVKSEQFLTSSGNKLKTCEAWSCSVLLINGLSTDSQQIIRIRTNLVSRMFLPSYFYGLCVIGAKEVVFSVRPNNVSSIHSDVENCSKTYMD